MPIIFNKQKPKYECSICLIIRDESEYLQEWLDWHIGQGVQHFYIYDHDSKYPITEFVKTLPQQIQDKITVIDWSGSHKNAQPEAYNHCLQHFAKDNKWLGFVDADEHVRVKNGQLLTEFLKNYTAYAGVYAIWMMFGANGQKEKSNLPLRERFTTVSPSQACAGMGKIFVQPHLIKEMVVHNAYPLDGHYIVGEYKDILPNAKIWSLNPTTDLICVDHYFTKSYEEWLEKLKRGRCHFEFPRKYNEFFEYNPDMEYCREEISITQDYEKSFKE